MTYIECDALLSVPITVPLFRTCVLSKSVLPCKTLIHPLFLWSK